MGERLWADWFRGLNSLHCLQPINFSLLLFDVFELEFLLLVAFVEAGVIRLLNTITRGSESTGRSGALGKQALWLVLESHTDAGFNFLNFMKALFNFSAGILVYPSAILWEEVIDDGSEEHRVSS